MTIKESQELIKKILNLDLEEVKIKTPKFKLTIKTTS
jgi:hypothetical protein|tara:strand:- start:3933 stop:4043 length:111 start_codon:yes stop_codon:yes gene_type:complete